MASPNRDRLFCSVTGKTLSRVRSTSCKRLSAALELNYDFSLGSLRLKVLAKYFRSVLAAMDSREFI